MLYLKELQKKEPTKSKISRRKEIRSGQILSKINEIDNKNAKDHKNKEPVF
jgi:hypothetical protein